MKKKVTLSIITPVFNGVRFIEFCIMNVIGQNCPNVEHIIVDGGSTDGTAEIIRLFAERYDHIKWVSEKDMGQSDAMNKGLLMASASVVGFLNVDDYYEPGVFDRVIKIFKGLPEPSIAVGNCSVWKDDGSLWFLSAPRKLSWRNILAGRYKEAFPMNASAYFYHISLHDLIGLYDVEDHYSMDVDFILRALMNSNSLYFNEIWGNYRYLPGTKTYEDDKSGENAIRLAALTVRYKKDLSSIDNLAVSIKNRYMKLSNRLKAIR